MYFRSLAGFGTDTEFAAKNGYPLAEIVQSHPLCDSSGIEASSVVLHRQGDTVRFLNQLHIDPGGFGMFQGVVYQFVRRTVEEGFQFAVKTYIFAEIVEPDARQ